MKTSHSRYAVLLVVAALTWLPPAMGQEPAANDFIVRAPASGIDGMAARIGLEIVAQMDVAPDARGNSVYLMRAPAAADPALIIADVEDLEPAAVAIERAALASLPETAEGLDLDQRGMSILNALESAARFSPPTSILDSGWAVGPEDRAIDPPKDGSPKSKELKLVMEHAVSTSEGEYSVSVGFSEGCAIELLRDSIDVGGVEFEDKKVYWQVTNFTYQRVRLESLSIGWPAANEGLKKVKLGRRTLYEVEKSPPSVAIKSGWKDEDKPEHREIAAGRTVILTLEFRKEAVTQPASYSLALDHSFAAGGDDCEVLAEGHLDLDKDEVRWKIGNVGDKAVTLDRVSLAWPVENGAIRAVKLGGKELFEPVHVEHGNNPDGTQRYLWRAFVNQPASQVMRVGEARDKHRGAGIVAIIDSGVDPDHPLFAHKLLPGYDFIRDEPGQASEWSDLDQRGMSILNLDQRGMSILNNDSVLALNPSTAAILTASQIAELGPGSLPPAFGHGTMVAGIVHLVAPEADLLPLKAFDAYGYGQLFDIVEAIYFAVDAGARVINMSFSLETFSPELMRAVNYAASRGVTCVASAGNEGDEMMAYPAALGNTLGVASTTGYDQLSVFSNRGSDLVTIAAPGEDVLTSYPGGGWAVASGTSFSAPWISGAVALFAEKNGRDGEPGRADYYLASEALSHARPIQGNGRGRAGHGRADLKEALDMLRGGLAMDAAPAGGYSIVVELAEGCTVEYPPAVSGTGCSTDVANQLSFDGTKVDWEITNVGEATITIQSIEVVWPAENERLKKIKLGGDEIYKQEHEPTSVTIDSGWHDDLEDRQIEPGETRELRLEFDEDAVES